MGTFIGNGTISLFGFLGAIIILLWGVHMVRKGAETLLLPYINISSPIFNNRLYALIAGIGGAALLQSSTALVLIISSIATKITIPLSIGLAFVLGADVGTALAVQLFTFNIKSIGPLLLLIGFLIIRTTKKKQITQNIGTILLGFGFILYALITISDISQSIRNSTILTEILSSILINDIALALLISILLTWLSHSSLAMVLLTVEMVSNHIIPLDLGISLVIGTNIGACLPAYIDSLGFPIEARRLILGNVIFRICGGIVAILFIRYISFFSVYLPFEPDRFLVVFHLVFNSLLALIFIFLLQPIEKLILKILPEPSHLSYKGIKTKFLSTDNISNVQLAITNLIKEVFRMSDYLYIMIDKTLRSLENNTIMPEIKKTEKILDSLNRSITKYLQKIYAQTLSEKEILSTMIIHTYCTDLEQAGDIIDNILYDSLEEKHKKHIQIAPEYRKQIETLFETLKENIITSQEIFRTYDIDKSKILIERKKSFKKKIDKLSLSHKQKILEGTTESIAINNIYLDIIQSLRRVNAHISGIAFSMLEREEYTSDH